MYPVICLAGQGGVGKDHVADLIVKNSVNSAKIALADEIKRNLSKLGIPKKYLWGKSEFRACTLNSNLLKYASSMPSNELEVWQNFLYEAKALNDFCARNLLQMLGKMVRDEDPDYWINTCWANVQKELFKDKSLIIVPDLRFRNEILFFKEKGCKIVNVTSPQGTLVKGKAAKDISETSLANVPKSWYDAVLVNDKTLPKESLIDDIKWILQ